MFTHLCVRQYRCFRDWQDIKLGRLHLVYGENASGKSVLVRLLPWLAASRRPGRHGLDPTWEGLHGAGIREVIWGGCSSC